MVNFHDAGVVPVTVSYSIGADRICPESDLRPVLYCSVRCEMFNYEGRSTIFKPGFPSEETAKMEVLCWHDAKREGLSGKGCAVRLLGAADGTITYEVMARIVRAA